MIGLRDIVAEAVGLRLELREGVDFGLFLRGVGAARRERHLHVNAAVLRRLLDRGGAAEHDQVGERDFLAAGRPLNSFWIAFELRQITFASCAGLLTSQSFCGARRMRAPLAPPRWSEPR